MCGAKNVLTAKKCHECGENFTAEDDAEPIKDSPLGVASFVVSLLAGVMMGSAFRYAGSVVPDSGGQIGEDDLVGVMLVGFGIIGGLMINVVGIGLGFFALFEPRTRKAFAALGTIVGLVLLIGVIARLANGAMQAAERNGFGGNVPHVVGEVLIT
jgi:hypothetical protein